MNLTEQLRKTLSDLKLHTWNASSWDGLAAVCCGAFYPGIAVTEHDQELALAIAQAALLGTYGREWPEKLDSLLETSRLMDDSRSAYLIQSQVQVGKIVLRAERRQLPTIEDAREVATEIGPRRQTGIPIQMRPPS